MRLAVDGFTSSRMARSVTRWGPCVARITKARYWGRVTSAAMPAKLRAATATKARLARRNASMSSTSSLVSDPIMSPII